jgi:DNA-directed RNA polymerase subunit RPC12/RpoP
MSEKKTFKVHCVKCKKPFHITFEKVVQPNPDAEEKADVWVECTYCYEKMMINIPRKYIAPGEPIYRGE